MGQQSNNKWTLKHLIRTADAQLQEITCCQFTKRAKAALRRKIGKNIVKLILSSVRLAKNEGVDEVISERHVILAENLLMYNTSRRFFRHLGTVGGIILGASLSALLAMLSSDKFSIPALLIPVALSVTGTFMVAVYIAKDS